MPILGPSLLVASLLLATGARSEGPDVLDAARCRDGALAATMTPACQRIASAAASLAAGGGAAAENEMAMALARRGREVADHAMYALALEHVTRALSASPDDPTFRTTEVWLLLGNHDFAKALGKARALRDSPPHVAIDEMCALAMVADASVQLGEYEEAERSVQVMLDHDPASVPALTRAAHLRELFGDLEGAEELLRSALGRVAEPEVEDRAWILTHIGHVQRLAGDLDASRRALEAALAIFPDYHYALAQLGRVHLAAGRADQAVAVLTRWHAAAPHPENLYLLATALEAAGRRRDARRAYERFVIEATAESHGVDNANRELARFLARGGAGIRPDTARALEVARLEASRRSDIDTLHALAVAKDAAGLRGEALATMARAMALGSRDPEILADAARMNRRYPRRSAR